MIKRLSLPALFCALVFGFLLAVSAGSWAQSDSARQSVQQRLDLARAELDQIASILRREQVTDQDLASRRGDLERLDGTVDALIEQLGPQFDAVKARLDQLGPAPDKDANVDADRAEQQKAFNDLDGQLKRARVLSVEIDQVKAQIVAKRRALFNHALFQRSFSIMSPDLWVSVVSEIPSDMKAAATIGQDWLSGASTRLAQWRGIFFAALLVLIAALYVLVDRLAHRELARALQAVEPTRLQKVVAALWIGAVTAIVPILAALAFAQILHAFDLVNARLEPVLQGLIESVRRIAFAAGIVRGLLAPLRPTWRLMELSDSAAQRLANLVMGVVIIVSLMKVIEAINELIAVSLPVAVAVHALGATAVALLMAVSLKGIMAPPEADDECLGPVVEPGQDWSGPLRFVAWIAIVAILGSVLIGYVAFGAFVTDQIVWVTFVGCVTYMLVLFANEGFEHALRPPAPIARAVMSSLGLRRESLEQLGVLLAGVATVSLTAAAILLVLAPWGIESDDMLANLRSAFFGFKIGDVTISLASIALALFFFAVVLFVTRTVQRWLEKKLLPHTQLDTGLRNSIRTSIGYVGFIVAVAISLGTLGFSFEKLAIVAGALSVGIGFGLQSIVNNFVSGLILLWERAVRVGDLVVVGEEQGYVRRINVRSTEIETFDRVTMIVPNSNLVTGVVKNWVRGDKIGRIKIPVAVNLEADPEHVRTVLIDVAKQHEMVEKLPAPNVMFIAMTESLLKFELICFVGDVEKAGRVKSDLHFAIHARFKIENINISPPAAPAPVIHIGGLDTLKKQD